MRERRQETAHQVEDEEAGVSHRVLDVVAEDPEVEHVAGQVHEAAVQEHAREERQGGGNGCDRGRELVGSEDHGRNHAELVNEELGGAGRERKLVHEHESVGRDQTHGEERSGPGRVIVPQRNHWGILAPAGARYRAESCRITLPPFMTKLGRSSRRTSWSGSPAQATRSA